MGEIREYLSMIREGFGILGDLFCRAWKRLWRCEQRRVMSDNLEEKDIESLAELVHKAYCKEYERQHGGSYWTGGDYSRLSEDTKEFDRVTVRTILKALHNNNKAINEGLDEIKDLATHFFTNRDAAPDIAIVIEVDKIRRVLLNR